MLVLRELLNIQSVIIGVFLLREWCYLLILYLSIAEL